MIRRAFFSRTCGAVSLTSLTAVGFLALAGCGPGSPATTTPAVPTSAVPTSAATAPAAQTAAGTANAASAGSCADGLTGTEPGVVQIFCDGTARIHVQAGSASKQFTGGQCEQAGDLWEATDGVITQAGVYKGPPVDVVSVNKDSNGHGTIQLTLGGKDLFVEGASFALSRGGKQAHLHGTTTALSDQPGTSVTVDVTC